jgi:hypothetical protein
MALGGLLENGLAQLLRIALAPVGQIEQTFNDVVDGNIERLLLSFVDNALEQPMQVFELVRAVRA